MIVPLESLTPNLRLNSTSIGTQPAASRHTSVVVENQEGGPIRHRPMLELQYEPELFERNSDHELGECFWPELGDHAIGESLALKARLIRQQGR